VGGSESGPALGIPPAEATARRTSSSVICPLRVELPQISLVSTADGPLRSLRLELHAFLLLPFLLFAQLSEKTQKNLPPRPFLSV